MRIPKELEGILTSDPEYLSGAVRFVGTRVPVQALLDTLTHKLPVSDFLEGFPNVTPDRRTRFSNGNRIKPGKLKFSLFGRRWYHKPGASGRIPAYGKG